jgi:hypothetical protein
MPWYKFKRVSLGREFVEVEADTVAEARAVADMFMPTDHEDYEWSELRLMESDDPTAESDEDPEDYASVWSI